MTIDEMLTAARRTIVRYQPREAAVAIEHGAVLIDLRCSNDREAEGTIPGAIPIPRNVMEWRVDPTSPDRDERVSRPEATFILFCNDGYSSSLAAAGLVDLEFERAGDIVGGFRAWKTAGLPVETR